jgi:hypothetical protein
MRFPTLALTCALGATAWGTIASAAPLSPSPSGPSLPSSPIEQTQFFYQGREFCWYDNGWRGPGWYWCGYGARPGQGYGGGPGWQGWRFRDDRRRDFDRGDRNWDRRDRNWDGRDRNWDGRDRDYDRNRNFERRDPTDDEDDDD